MLSLIKTIRLGAPLAGAQMVTFLLTFIDAVAVGYFGDDAIAGLALASSFLITVQLLGNGTISIIGIQNARYNAIGRQHDTPSLHLAGLMFALIYFLISLAVVVGYLTVVAWFSDVTEESKTFIIRYLAVAAFAIPFSMTFIMLRSVLASMELTRSTFFVSVVALGCKIGVNGIAVLFFPTLEAGAVAMGLGLIASNIVLCGGLSVAYFRAMNATLPGRKPGRRPHARDVWLIVTEGFPIGVTYAFEAAIYAVIAWMMGLLGQVALAAHYAVKQYVHLTFMILNGIAQITSLRISGLWYSGSRAESTRIGVESTLFAIAVSLSMGVTYWLFSDSLARVIVPLHELTPELLIVVRHVFLAAIFMQLFDNIANILAGVLRGIGKSALAMISTAAGYYIVGLPLAYAFAFPFGLGAFGAWLGVSLGLAATCVCMLTFYRAALYRDSN